MAWVPQKAVALICFLIVVWQMVPPDYTDAGTNVIHQNTLSDVQLVPPVVEDVRSIAIEVIKDKPTVVDGPRPVASHPGKHVVFAVSSALLHFGVNLWLSMQPYLQKGEIRVSIVALSPNLCDSFEDTIGGILNCTYAASLQVDVVKEVTYQHKEYLTNVAKKLTAYADIFGQTPDGTLVLLSDVDVVWLGDPFASSFVKEKNNVEIWFSNADAGAACFKSKTVNTGIFFARSSPKTRALFHVAIQALKEDKSYDHGDQGAMQYALEKMKMPFALLPCDQFTNGNVYWAAKLAPNPTILHTSWFFGSDAKEECLRASGFWHTEGFKHRDVKAQIQGGGQVAGCKRV
eukprot:m.118307 g.118307  ORF g.118307 m.118307 type:complete len:346 (-) comp28651_c0_seq2:35-1072(-)